MDGEARILINRRDARKSIGSVMPSAAKSPSFHSRPETGRGGAPNCAKQSQFPSGHMEAKLMIEKELGMIWPKVRFAKQSQFPGTGCRAFAGEGSSRVEWSPWKAIL